MTDAAPREPTDTEAGDETPGLRVSVSARGDTRAAALGPDARRRLVNLLLGKAALDLLFVCALAAGFHYAAFRPSFRGALDHADARSVRGWVVDRSEPGRRVEVQLYLDGRFVASAVADRPREGSAQEGGHGFVFRLDPPPPGEHEARVYALHAPAEGRRHTLQQLGSPVRFVSAAEGGR